MLSIILTRFSAVFVKNLKVVLYFVAEYLEKERPLTATWNETKRAKVLSPRGLERFRLVSEICVRLHSKLASLSA